MIKLLDLIEAKQVGILYHFTSYESLIQIIKDNFILKTRSQVNQGHKYEQNSNYISFTRSKNIEKSSVPQEARIIIDGSKLSEHYKIEQYADYKQGYGRGYNKHWEEDRIDESEERIDASKYGGKVDISKCVLKIDIVSFEEETPYRNKYDTEVFPNNFFDKIYNNYKELIKLLDNKKIPYNIIQKF